MCCPKALLVLAFVMIFEPANLSSSTRMMDAYRLLNQRSRHPQYDDYSYYATNLDYNDLPELLVQPYQRPQLSPKPTFSLNDLRGNLKTDMRPHFRNGSQCKTSHGPDPGKACIFPFTYEGTEHNECAQQISSPEPWCATQLDAQDGTVLNWGLCDHTLCFKEQGRLEKKSETKI